MKQDSLILTFFSRSDPRLAMLVSAMLKVFCLSIEFTAVQSDDQEGVSRKTKTKESVDVFRQKISTQEEAH